MNKDPTSPSAGRPREFDTHAALARAIAQFSAHGYHGTSISDLNTALGLTTGSIYKAWGDKHGLLMAALDRYIELRLEALEDVVKSASNGLDKIAAALSHYADISSGKSGETGCLVVETAMELWRSDKVLAERLARHEQRRRTQFQAWLRDAQSEGVLEASADIDASADLLIALTQGMRVLGKSGTARARMQALADQAVAMLGSKTVF